MTAFASLASTNSPASGLPATVTATEVVEILLFRGGFNTSVVVAATTLLGLAAGIIGGLALLRKRSLVADALGHATLPGIAAAFLAASALGLGRSMPVLLLGAALSAVLGMLALHALLRVTRIREDAAIAIVLSVGFAIGVVLLSVVQSQAAAGAAGLHHFIYGQTAAMQVADAVLMGALALAGMLAASLLLKEFGLVAFDEPFARADGWPVGLVDLLLMGLVVVATVAGLQAVGLILVVALLVVPPVAARYWTDRLRRFVVLSAAFGAAGGYLGAVASAALPGKPAGAVIVLVSGALFLLSMLFAPARGIVAVALDRLAGQVRIAGEHLLERTFESWRSTRGIPVIEPHLLQSIAHERGWSGWLRAATLAALRWRGLTIREDGTLRLTGSGLLRGAQVSRNHRLWEQYLVTHADLAPSHVDWSVDLVEHVLSPDLVAALEAQLRDRGVDVPRLKEFRSEGIA